MSLQRVVVSARLARWKQPGTDHSLPRCARVDKWLSGRRELAVPPAWWRIDFLWSHGL